jgi:hypothetical protein
VDEAQPRPNTGTEGKLKRTNFKKQIDPKSQILKKNSAFLAALFFLILKK